MKRNIRVDWGFLGNTMSCGMFMLLVVGVTIGAPQQQLTGNVSEDPTAAVFVYRDVEN